MPPAVLANRHILGGTAAGARSPVLLANSAVRPPTEIPDFNQHPPGRAAKKEGSTVQAAAAFDFFCARAQSLAPGETLSPVFEALPGAGSFIVNGATPAKNSTLTSAGAELHLANGVSLLGKFDGEFASHSSTYAGTGAVRYTW